MTTHHEVGSFFTRQGLSERGCQCGDGCTRGERDLSVLQREFVGAAAGLSHAHLAPGSPVDAHKDGATATQMPNGFTLANALHMQIHDRGIDPRRLVMHRPVVMSLAKGIHEVVRGAVVGLTWVAQQPGCGGKHCYPLGLPGADGQRKQWQNRSFWP